MNKIIIEGRPVAHTPYYDMMWYDMLGCVMCVEYCVMCVDMRGEHDFE